MASRPKDQVTRNRWADMARRVKRRVGRNNVGIMAGGVAFYGILGLFPALVALISLVAFFLDPEQVKQQLSFVTQSLNPSAGQFIVGQIRPLVQGGRGVLSFALVTGLLGATWSVSTAMSNVMSAIDVAYEGAQREGFVKRRGKALLFTAIAFVTGLLLVVGLVYLPLAAGRSGIGLVTVLLLRWGRWPVLALVVFVSLLVVYRYGARRAGITWSTVVWGAVAATGAWLISSLVFSFYVTNVAHLERMYGALSAVVILLLWFLLSAFVMLLGAELNAELETVRSGQRGPRGE